MTWRQLKLGRSDKILAMIVSLRHLLGWILGAVSSREDLILENLALRQQLLALHAMRPRRRLTALHKLFWVLERGETHAKSGRQRGRQTLSHANAAGLYAANAVFQHK